MWGICVEEGCDTINPLNPRHIFVPDPSQDQDVQRRMSWFFCVQWVQLRWEVIVRFVDIGGFYNHHCLNILFITSSVICAKFGSNWPSIFRDDQNMKCWQWTNNQRHHGKGSHNVLSPLHNILITDWQNPINIPVCEIKELFFQKYELILIISKYGWGGKHSWFPLVCQ